MDIRLLQDAQRLREDYLDDPEGVEHIARAALLLRDLEWIDGKCPSCRYPQPTDGSNNGHLWQCELAGALNMLDDLLT